MYSNLAHPVAESVPLGHRLRLFFQRTDLVLLFTVVLIVCWSVVMVYSTTGILATERFKDPLFFVKRQVGGVVLGFLAGFICMFLPLRVIRDSSWYLYGAAILLLLIPLVPGLGERAGGAQRWIRLPGLHIQPAEFVKLLFVGFLAGYWERRIDLVGKFSTSFIKPFLLLTPFAVILLAQPDFGSTAIMALVAFSTAVALGAPLRFLAIGGAGVASIAAVLVVVSPYRMIRFASFLSPLKDAGGKGYQLIQSLIAVASGQTFGVGLGESQQKLFFLPAAHTDFIFAVIAEELGFAGALVLILMFVVLLWRCIRIAQSVAGDTFAFALAVGLTVVLVLPAFLNMGVVLGLLPTKGLVLPLMGYGGSSMIASLAAVGLLLGLAREGKRGQR